MGEESVGSDVEWYSETEIGRTLVHDARESILFDGRVGRREGNVELTEHVTGR